MSTPDGTWEDSDDLIQAGAIAVDQYEVMAGVAFVDGGALPAVMVRVKGVVAEDVGVDGAQRVPATFILRHDDATRFAAQIVEATKMRPA